MTNHFIPLSVPEIRGNERQYLRECLDTNWVSYVGPHVTRLEEMMASYIGTTFAVATNSGTAALHIALMIAGIGPGDEVLVPDLTFIAPVNAIRYCGAEPVFMDIDPDYWQMDAGKVAIFLDTECVRKNEVLINKNTGRRVRALLPVHLLGHPCDMNPLLKLARSYQLIVIEDAAESLGAKYEDKRIGSLGDLGCFSYNGNKIITTGGGGMITTDNESWAKRAKYLTTQARDSSEEYIHESIGYNYRLTNIQAALGVGQMEMLNEYVTIKRSIAWRYEEALRSVPGIILPREAPWAFSTFWLYTILIDEDEYGHTSRELQKELAVHNIQARPLWAPIHEQRPYRHCTAYHIDIAPQVYRKALSLPCSIGLSEADQQRVIQVIREFRQHHSGVSSLRESLNS